VQRDWLDDGAWVFDAWDESDTPDWIFTNPPFSILEEFVTRGLQRARKGVALLLRLNALEGVERHPLLAGPKATMTQLAVFSERVPMVLGKWDVDARSATAYALFVWQKWGAPLPPMWLPPGTRDRLWRPDDAVRFGAQGAMPLFDGLTPIADTEESWGNSGGGPPPVVSPSLATTSEEEPRP
jgi:hypothetical protein